MISGVPCNNPYSLQKVSIISLVNLKRKLLNQLPEISFKDICFVTPDDVHYTLIG